MQAGTESFKQAAIALLRSAGGSVTIPIEGESMRPLLNPGDSVAVVFCPASDLSVGDVLVYQAGGTIAVHRVLRRRTSGTHIRIYQKGDNQDYGFWLSEDQVLGRVCQVIAPNGRKSELPPPSILGRIRCRLNYFRARLRQSRSRVVKNRAN